MSDTTNEQRRPHLSATQLDMFAKCPESWRRRYVEKDIIPPKIAMFKGRAVHKAAEVNMRQKIESRVDLPSSEIVDAAVAEYETCLKAEQYELAPGENEKTAAKQKDVVASMAQIHAEQQAPEYQPAAVEQFFKIELPALSHDIVGYIDLITEDKKVVDFKTSKRSLSIADTEQSVQLSLYAASMAGGGKDDVLVRLDVIVEGGVRSPAKRQVLEATRDKTDLPVLANRIAVVSKTIDANLFPPAAPGSWWCSENWCGYWRSCPYVNSERIQVNREVEKAIKVLEEGIQ
jgi:hypothetical protein